jgi:hypothetical protein
VSESYRKEVKGYKRKTVEKPNEDVSGRALSNGLATTFYPLL